MCPCCNNEMSQNHVCDISIETVDSDGHDPPEELYRTSDPNSDVSKRDKPPEPPDHSTKGPVRDLLQEVLDRRSEIVRAELAAMFK